MTQQKKIQRMRRTLWTQGPLDPTAWRAIGRGHYRGLIVSVTEVAEAEREETEGPATDCVQRRWTT